MDDRPRHSALTLHALEFSKNPDVFVLEDPLDSACQSDDGEVQETEEQVAERQRQERNEAMNIRNRTRAAHAKTVQAERKWRRKAPHVTKNPRVPHRSLQYVYETMMIQKQPRLRPAVTIIDWEVSLANWRVSSISSKQAILDTVETSMTGPGGILGRAFDIRVVKEPTAPPDNQVKTSETYQLLLDVGGPNGKKPIFVEQPQLTCHIETAVNFWIEHHGPSVMAPDRGLQVWDSSKGEDEKVVVQEETLDENGQEITANVERSVNPRAGTMQEIYNIFVDKDGRPRCPLNWLGLMNDVCDWRMPKAIHEQSLKRMLWEKNASTAETPWAPRQYCILTMAKAYSPPHRDKLGYLTCAATIGGVEGGRKIWEFPAGDLTAVMSSFGLGTGDDLAPDQEWATLDLSASEGVLIILPGQIHGVRTETDTLMVGYQDWTAATFHLSLESIREEFFGGAGSNDDATVEEFQQLSEIVGFFNDLTVFDNGMRDNIAHSARKLVKAYMHEHDYNDEHMNANTTTVEGGTFEGLITELWSWLQAYDEE